MKKQKLIYVLLASLILLFGSNVIAQVQDAPASVAAAMILKVVGFEKGISAGGDVNIYVLGAADVASELKKGIGTAIGKATLKSVESGEALPGTKPTILFIGNAAKLSDCLAYTHANKILSTTGKPDLVSSGVTLGFGVGADSKPKILLNLSASSEEGLEWNPAILKVAQTIQ